jgi:CrcB protein
VRAALLVSLGGIVGALSRHFLSGWIARALGTEFPWGIFFINVAGCVLMGVVIGLAEQTRWISDEVRWLVVTGFLGSLTTFSTLSGDTFHLWRNGHVGLAALNAGGSLAVGLALLAGAYQVTIWLRS